MMRLTVVAGVLVGLVAVSAATADAQELQIAEKDPAIALGFAWLCPGCGHLYSGETAKGAVIAAVSVGSVLTGLAVQLARTDHAMRRIQECGWTADGFCSEVRGGTDLTPILVGSAIGLAGYIYGLIDAGPSARRMNATQGIGFGALDVKPAVAPDGFVRTELSLRLPVVVR